MAQEQSVRSKRDVQANQIRIIDQECVNNQNQVCANNGTSECYQCAIFAGSTENPIRYVAAWKTKDFEQVANFSPDELTWPIESSKENVVDEDEANTLHFSKFIQPAITHIHSGSEYVHRHYIFNRLGDNCILCGAPVVGTNLCERCNASFNGIGESGNGLANSDDGTIVYDSNNKKFVLVQDHYRSHDL